MHFQSVNRDCIVEFPIQRASEKPQEPPLLPGPRNTAPASETAAPDLAELAAMRSKVEALRVRLEEAKEGHGQSALALAVQLRRLRQRHNIHPNLLPLPLGPPIEARSIKIEGYAATADVDADRSRFLPTCWPRLDASKIKLLMSHDEAREAGTVDSIEVDALGRVLITATVSDPFAMRMPAMSISASVDKFTIREPDSRGFVGEIERVTAVNEISLTSTPQNRAAVVLERSIPTAVDLSYEEMIDRIKRMQKMVQEMMAA
jgi:phage head maturation protease